jgi:hypothetical protein
MKNFYDSKNGVDEIFIGGGRGKLEGKHETQ